MLATLATFVEIGAICSTMVWATCSPKSGSHIRDIAWLLPSI